jgi:GTP-binding protein EngB required for normal cell division
MVKQPETLFNAGGSASTPGAVPMAAAVPADAAADGAHPTAAGLADEETIIMVGNPGMGKSTLLNQLCETVLFRSGEGEGHHGCTTHLQWHEIPPASGWPKLNLCDTPGLSDLTMAEKAAAQIKAALERKPSARLLFVMKENDNRVAPSDVATIQAVLDAIDMDPQDKQNRYGIIFNQLSPPRYKKLLDPGGRNPVAASRRRMVLQEAVNSGKYQTSSFHYIKREDDLESEDNALLGEGHELTQRLRAFALMVHPIRIPSVTSVEWRGGEERVAQAKAAMDQKIEAIQALNQQQIDDMNSQFDAKSKQRQAEVEQMVQQQQQANQAQLLQQQRSYDEQRKADQDAADKSMDRVLGEQANQRAEMQAMVERSRQESAEAARAAEERMQRMLEAQEEQRAEERARAERREQEQEQRMQAARAEADAARANSHYREPKKQTGFWQSVADWFN